MLKALNLAVMFFTELVMLFAFGYFGYGIDGHPVVQYGAAILLVAACISLWAVWAAPKSSRRLSKPYLQIFRLVMFLTAALCLYQSDLPHIAVAMVIAAIATQIASFWFE